MDSELARNFLVVIAAGGSVDRGATARNQSTLACFTSDSELDGDLVGWVKAAYDAAG